MTSDTRAELICLHYNLVNSNAFTGSRSNLYLTTQMDMDCSNIPVDHVGIFRDHYKDAMNTTSKQHKKRKEIQGQRSSNQQPQDSLLEGLSEESFDKRV
jgi:hypothetical protein